MSPVTSSRGLGGGAEAAPNRLGQQVARRFARPGPGGQVRRTVRLGLVGAAARRFAAGVARPVAIRRQLAGPGDIRPRQFDPISRPPRWWVPPEPDADAVTRTWGLSSGDSEETLPKRGLPRAARSVPTEDNHAPGEFSATMRGTPIRVRRIKEVAEVGDVAGGGTRLMPPAPSSTTGPVISRTTEQSTSRPPGREPGDGTAHRSTVGAAPRTASAERSGVRPPTRGGLLRRAWAGVVQRLAGREGPGPARSVPPAQTPSTTATAAPAGPSAVAPAVTAAGTSTRAPAPPASPAPAAGPAIAPAAGPSDDAAGTSPDGPSTPGAGSVLSGAADVTAGAEPGPVAPPSAALSTPTAADDGAAMARSEPGHTMAGGVAAAGTPPGSPDLGAGAPGPRLAPAGLLAHTVRRQQRRQAAGAAVGAIGAAPLRRTLSLLPAPRGTGAGMGRAAVDAPRPIRPRPLPESHRPPLLMYRHTASSGAGGRGSAARPGHAPAAVTAQSAQNPDAWAPPSTPPAAASDDSLLRSAHAAPTPAGPPSTPSGRAPAVAAGPETAPRADGPSSAARGPASLPDVATAHPGRSAAADTSPPGSARPDRAPGSIVRRHAAALSGGSTPDAAAPTDAGADAVGDPTSTGTPDPTVPGLASRVPGMPGGGDQTLRPPAPLGPVRRTAATGHGGADARWHTVGADVRRQRGLVVARSMAGPRPQRGTVPIRPTTTRLLTGPDGVPAPPGVITTDHGTTDRGTAPSPTVAASAIRRSAAPSVTGAPGTTGAPSPATTAPLSAGSDRPPARIATARAVPLTIRRHTATVHAARGGAVGADDPTTGPGARAPAAAEPPVGTSDAAPMWHPGSMTAMLATRPSFDRAATVQTAGMAAAAAAPPLLRRSPDRQTAAPTPAPPSSPATDPVTDPERPRPARRGEPRGPQLRESFAATAFDARPAAMMSVNAIRPATMDLLRRSHVAPPRGVPTGTRGAEPPVPASAVGAGAVIRRSSPPAAPSADTARRGTDSLIGSVPAAAFDRARAELAGSSTVAESPSAEPTAHPGTDSADGGNLIRRWTKGVIPAGPQRGDSGPMIGASRETMPRPRSVADSLSSREWEELVDQIARRIEGRIVSELARRGRHGRSPRM